MSSMSVRLSFLLRGFACCTIIFSVAVQSVCQYHSNFLPIPLELHVGAYSPAEKSAYLIGGRTLNNFFSTAVYKWGVDADNSSSWFTEIGTIPLTDDEWRSSTTQPPILDGILYTLGVSGATRTVNRYSVAENTWLAHRANAWKELTLGCVAGNASHLIMVDGWNEGDYLDQHVYIQVFDTVLNRWDMHVVVAPFNTLGESRIQWRYQYCYFVNEKLYIFGGKFGTNYFLNGIWRYDIVNQSFIEIGALPQPSAYGVTVYDGHDHIYLVGGYTDIMGQTNTIHAFDIRTESVTASDAMYAMQSVDSSVAMVFDRKLWIFGGYNDQDGVSMFLPPSNETTTTALIMETTASAADGGKNESVNQGKHDLVLAIVVSALLACACASVFVLVFFWMKRKRRNKKEQDLSDKSPAGSQVNLQASQLNAMPVGVVPMSHVAQQHQQGVNMQPMYPMHPPAQAMQPMWNTYAQPVQAIQPIPGYYDPYAQPVQPVQAVQPMQPQMNYLHGQAQPQQYAHPMQLQPQPGLNRKPSANESLFGDFDDEGRATGGGAPGQ